MWRWQITDDGRFMLLSLSLFFFFFFFRLQVFFLFIRTLEWKEGELQRKTLFCCCCCYCFLCFCFRFSNSKAINAQHLLQGNNFMCCKIKICLKNFLQFKQLLDIASLQIRLFFTHTCFWISQFVELIDSDGIVSMNVALVKLYQHVKARCSVCQTLWVVVVWLGGWELNAMKVSFFWKPFLFVCFVLFCFDFWFLLLFACFCFVLFCGVLFLFCFCFVFLFVCLFFVNWLGE